MKRMDAVSARWWGAGLALLCALATPSGLAAPPRVLPGDGAGIVDGFDSVRQVVRMGKEEVALSPKAAATLRSQLSQHSIRPGGRFAVKYGAVGGADGRVIIDSIYVVPPKRR